MPAKNSHDQNYGYVHFTIKMRRHNINFNDDVRAKTANLHTPLRKLITGNHFDIKFNAENISPLPIHLHFFTQIESDDRYADWWPSAAIA